MFSDTPPDNRLLPRVSAAATVPSAATVMVCAEPNRPQAPRRLPLPTRLGTGEVLVALRLATICGSDLHTFAGRREEPMPTVLGHEGVGVVLASGGGRPDLTVGDRVTWSIADSCGECPFCTEYQLPQKCVELFKYGHALLSNGSGLNGCYASHILLRKGTHIVKLPPEVDDRAAVAANCALATVVRAVKLLPPGARSILIQGAGLLGAFSAALLKEAGIATVYVIDRSPERLAVVATLGVRTLLASEETSIEPWQTTLQKAHPYGLDAALEVAGVRSVVPEAVGLLRPGGHYVMAGLVHPDSALSITAEQLIRKCLTVHATHNYGPVHLDEAVAFLARAANALPFDQIISPALALGDLNAAFELARTGKWLRVAVDCTRLTPEVRLRNT